jgi:epoxide hydrolase
MSALKSHRICISEAALSELATRLKATRWIDDPFEGDWRFGAPLPFVRALCDYWLHEFDWRALEGRLNRDSQVMTEVDGLTLHAMTRRSSRTSALPLMLLHGWPSSFLEFVDLYDPLCEPANGDAAFHVVTPSLPGYGFSTTKSGISPQRVAPLLVTLMERLGYERFVVQGGDWGSLIATEICRQFPERVMGLHLNLINGSPPSDKDRIPLSAQEQSWVNELNLWQTYPHLILQSHKPASLTYALNDSPAGLAAWIGEKIHDWIDSDGLVEPFVPFDRLVANIALYWFTGTAGSAALLYHELAHNPPDPQYVKVPTAAAIFPKEVVKLPRAWAEGHYNIVQWNVFDHGGHFPALEHPDVLVHDLQRFAAVLGALERDQLGLGPSKRS